MFDTAAGQLAFWSPGELVTAGVRDLRLPDADVLLATGFFGPQESRELFAALRREVPFRGHRRTMYDRVVEVPRVSCWYGPPEAGDVADGDPVDVAWPAVLAAMRRRVEAFAGLAFDAVLVHLYRDGRDSVAWHSDREVHRWPQPVIGSVSLGATRRFRLRHKTRKDLPVVDLDLVEGTLLLMRGDTQRCWEHTVPKVTGPVGERINLTFRIAGA